MLAVVQTAGEGSRLRPCTETKPKALVNVAGAPLLTHGFEQLRKAGVDELIVVVGYRKEDLIAHYGDSYRDIPINYVHQRKQLGLGHAVLQTEQHVNDDFLVLNGDNVLRANIGTAMRRQNSEEVDATLLMEQVSEEEAKTTGVIETDDSGRVTNMIEKPDDPPSRLVATGCYVLPPKIFYALHLFRPSDRGEYELSDAVALLAAAGHTIETVTLEGWRVNVNTPEDVERAKELLRER